MITMTSRPPRGAVVGGPPSWLQVHTGHPAASSAASDGDVGVGDVGVDLWPDWWMDREFAAIVAANWPAQEQPAPRRPRTRVGTLAAPRQPDNRGCLGPVFGDGGSLAGPVVYAPGSVVSRQRSPPPSPDQAPAPGAPRT